MVLLICELLIIDIPPTAIPSIIYTIYETLTGVEATEVPSVSFSRDLRRKRLSKKMWLLAVGELGGTAHM